MDLMNWKKSHGTKSRAAVHWIARASALTWIGFQAFVASAPAAANEISLDAVLRGQVQFERRSTLIPMVVCEDGSPCARPATYWVIVLRQNGTRYELSQPLAMGAERVPNQVELAGVNLRNGAEVVLEGRVEKVSKDFSIVTEVKRLQIVHSIEADEALESIFPTPNVESWECRSAEQERDLVVVQVWYASQPEGFRMKVLSRAGSPSAEFDRVSLFREPRSAYFSAKSLHQNAKLRITGNDRLLSLPAELRVEDETNVLPFAGRAISMDCRKVIVH